MGKLIYKDDNDVEHEITLQQISSKNIKSGDIVVVHYEVGDAPSEETRDALAKLRELIVSNTPKDVRVLAIATRNGHKDIELKVMKDKTENE